MSETNQKQKVVISKEEYRKLKKEHERLGELLKRVEQKGESELRNKQLLERLKKGYELGSLNYSDRSELYQR